MPLYTRSGASRRQDAGPCAYGLAFLGATAGPPSTLLVKTNLDKASAGQDGNLAARRRRPIDLWRGRGRRGGETTIMFASATTRAARCRPKRRLMRTTEGGRPPPFLLKRWHATAPAAVCRRSAPLERTIGTPPRAGQRAAPLEQKALPILENPWPPARRCPRSWRRTTTPRHQDLPHTGPDL